MTSHHHHHHKTWVNRLSHRIKHYLGARFDAAHLRLFSFIISLVACLAAGSILLFSLYSVAIHKLVGMSYLQINFIASLSAIGMYLCLPVLGYLSDSYGPSLLAMMAIWLFVPSYYCASAIIQAYKPDAGAGGAQPHFVLVAEMAAKLGIVPDISTKYNLYGLSACFFFVGLATSALYFLSVLTCAKIYPQHKGLAISLPVSCYGMSSLILSQLLKLDYFHKLSDTVSSTNDSTSLDLVKVFNFYVYLYLVVGTLNFIASSIVSIESEVVFSNSANTETTPLIASSVEDEESSYSTASSSSTSCTGDDLFLPSREVIEPLNHHQRFIEFLKDPSAWLILISLVVNIGPMEAFQNNLGSIIGNVTTPGAGVDLADQVSVMATSSTVSRLALGVLSDYLSLESRKHPICRVWLLVFVIVVGIIGQLLPIVISETSGQFSMISVLNGFSYGALFTIYPTIVASIWGIDIMGSTWGSLMVAPAIGSVGYSLLYGLETDGKCSFRGNEKDVTQFTCVSEYFSLSAASVSLSLVIVLFVWRYIWFRRGFRLF